MPRLSGPDRIPIWIPLLPLVALTAIVTTPASSRLYVSLVSATTYSLIQYLLPDCRFRKEHHVCPLNWALILFLVKLVFLPALVMWAGPAFGTMHALPNRAAIERALLIETVAYVAFCLALRFVRNKPGTGRISGLEVSPSVATIIVFAASGLIGMFVVFGSFGTLLEYFANPLRVAQDLRSQDEGTVWSLMGTILRPFLAFSLVLFWSRQIDRQASTSFLRSIVTLLVACGVAAANLTYSFNRGAVVFPLLALAASFIAHVHPVPRLVLVGAGLMVALPLLFVGAYRANPQTIEGDDLAAIDVPEQIQVYGNAPQFMASFLDQTGWGRSLYWGRTLIASVMDPIPMLGKGFRESSGTYVYNRMIYNESGYTDQIISFQCELFANFHLPGVVAGFFVFGLAIAELQRRAEVAQSPFAAFAVQYVGIWTAMLVVWSISVLAQILIYFCWPIYTYVFVNWCRRAGQVLAGPRRYPRLQPAHKAL
jgi:hypothetical protein